MSTSVKNYESPIQLWVMLGPLFVVGTVIAMNIHAASIQWGLPIVSLGGLFLCYFLRWRGCLLALILLSMVSAFQLIQYPSLGILWTSLLSLSFASSFIVTTLFLEKSQGVLDTLNDQSQQTKEALTQLEGLSSAQAKFDSERRVLMLDRELLKKKLAENEADLHSVQQKLLEKEDYLHACESKLAENVENLQSHEKLVSIVRQELMTSHSKHEKLLQELFDSRQQEAILEQQIARLQDQNKEAVGAMHEATQAATNRDTNTYKAQETQILHDAVIQEMKDEIETLSKEKKSLEMTLSSLQGEFEVLSQKAINESKLFEIQNAQVETLRAAVERSVEELKTEKIKNDEFKHGSEIYEKSLNQQIENLSKRLSTTTQQIGEWQRKLHDYSSLTERNAVLQAQIQAHVSEKLEMQQKFDVALKALNQDHVSEINLLQHTISTSLQMQKQEHEIEKTALQSQYEADLSTLSQEHASEKTQLQQQYEIALQKQLQDHASDKAAWQHKFGAVIESEGQRHLSEKAELEYKFNAAIESLKLKHDLEKSELQHKFDADLNSKNQTNLSDKAELQQKFDITVDALIQQHISEKAKLEHNFQDALKTYNQKNAIENTELCLQIGEMKGLYEQAQVINNSNAHLLEECERFKAEITVLKLEIEKVKHENEVLHHIKEANQNEIPQQIVIALSEEEERKRNRELRRLEGLYLQMREQFNEKSSVLDSTRRELFLMQEKFLSIQKEHEEKEIFGESECEQSLYNIISITDVELKHQIVELNHEISQLHSLVDVLMNDSTLIKKSI